MNALTGYLIAGALALAILAGVGGYYLGTSVADDQWTAKVATANEQASEAARKEEATRQAATQLIGESYELGKKAALEAAAIEYKKRITDLAADNVRLRSRWTCDMPKATGPTSQSDATAREQRDSLNRIAGNLERVDRAYGQCAVQLKSLQDFVRAERS